MSQLIRGQQSTNILQAMRGPEESVATLVEEMRKDTYVALGDRVIRAVVSTAQVSVTTDSPDGRSRVVAVAHDELWNTHVNQMLECEAFGRQAFEIVWSAVGAGVGVDLPLRLEPMPYENTEPLFGDPSEPSKVTGVLVGKGDEQVPLEMPYGWWLSLDSTAMNPYGVSRYKGAAEKVWRERREIIQRRMTFARKYALGNAIVYGPPTRLGPNGQQVDVHEEIGSAFKSSEGGDWMFFPNEWESNPDGSSHRKYEIDRTNEGAKDGTPLIDMADALGSELLLARGIPPRVVVEGDSGSFSLVTWQMLILFATVEDVLGQIVSQFQEVLVGSAEKLNGVRGIVCNFVPLTQRPDDLVVEIVKEWLKQPALSPLVMSGQVDVRQMLEMAGVPVSSKAAEKLATMVPGQQATPAGDTSAPVESVADTALNGAQIASLMDVVNQVAAKAMPAEVVYSLIEAAFPMLSAQQIQKIMGPLVSFNPSPSAQQAVAQMAGPLSFQMWR